MRDPDPASRRRNNPHVLTALNWHPRYAVAARDRDELTGLRGPACFAQDLPLAIAGGDPLTVAVVHVARRGDRSVARVAEALAKLPGFPYRTGPDTFAVLAPGVSPWDVEAALAGLSRRCRRARVRAGVTVAGTDARAAAQAALTALERADAARVPVAVG